MITTEYLLPQTDRYIQFKLQSDSEFQGFTHVLEILTFHIQSTLIISTSVISNNRLSRRENLVLVLTQKSKIRLQNIVEKRRNCSQEQFLPLSTIFSIYITNLRSQITQSIVKFGSSNWFSSILLIWYVEVRISQRVFEGPFSISR